MATYLPTSSLTPLYTFLQFTTAAGVAAFETALRAAFSDQNVQVYADDDVAGNALVVAKPSASQVTAFSVAPNTWVSYSQGTWQKRTVAEMAGGINSVFTAYP